MLMVISSVFVLAQCLQDVRDSLRGMERREDALDGIVGIVVSPPSSEGSS
jgi:hypothetical protein